MNILKLRIRTADEWAGLFQTDLPNGGLFVPTTVALEAGDTAVIEVAAPQLPNKVMIRTRVRSWRPALPRLRVRAGAIVEFDAEEVGKRDFVSEVLAGKRSGMPRRRQSRLPVAIPVKYRLSSSGQFTEVQMTEISIGGALLATETPLPIGGELVIEVVPPGAAAALAIGGRVAYHVPSAGSTGVRFLVRDSDGSRRLRELVRRLKVL